MGNNKPLQWASLLLPTIIAIIMAVMTFSNRATTISATTLEKVVQLEKELSELKGELNDLDKEKVDVTNFNMLVKKIDDVADKLDDLRVN
jgi:peptidoglycan hydrolase CwlO-like protein